MYVRAPHLRLSERHCRATKLHPLLAAGNEPSRDCVRLHQTASPAQPGKAASRIGGDRQCEKYEENHRTLLDEYYVGMPAFDLWYKAETNSDLSVTLGQGLLTECSAGLPEKEKGLAGTLVARQP